MDGWMARDDYKMKMAVISGASHALEFKRKEPNATNEEIIQKVSDEIDEILNKIDEGQEI